MESRSVCRMAGGKTMRRTAWILAALGIAGSSLRGYAQETGTRTSIPVKRAPAAKAPADTASRDFYDDLFGGAPADEPTSDAKPKVRSLADSMESSRALDELLTKDGPAPASAKDAFPARKTPAAGR